MMKSYMRLILVALLVLCLLPLQICVADDLVTLSIDELYQLRERINNEILKRIEDSIPELDLVYEGAERIIDIFPDEALAKYVRDKTGKLSIEQTVTQEELDGVRFIQLQPSESDNIKDLTGISRLRNLDFIMLFNGSIFEVDELPDEFYTLTNLKSLDIAHSPIDLSSKIGNLVNLEVLNIAYTKVSSLPDTLFNLTQLRELNIDNTDISVLPEAIANLSKLERLYMRRTRIDKLPNSICTLTNLNTLYISQTDISELPEAIGNLKNLKRLDISGTKITSLPDSMYGLNLESLNMTGLPIR